MHSYRACGLTIDSALPLPGLEPSAPVAAPDAVFRLGAVPEALAGAEHIGPTWQIAGNCFLLSIPNLARFLISDGYDVVAEAAPGTPTEDLALFLGGSVLGILLHQRRTLVLHASAVVVNGRVALFCGPSAAGKSTLAAMLEQRGYPVAADDICALTVHDGLPAIAPDGRRLKLWQDAIDALALDARAAGAVRQRIGKYYLAPGQQAEGPLPIGAVYMLREARGPLAPGISRPNVVDSARALLRNAYRPLLVREMGQRQLYFEAGTRFAARGLIHRLTRSPHFAERAQTIDWLETHWRDLGLLDDPAKIYA